MQHLDHKSERAWLTGSKELQSYSVFHLDIDSRDGKILVLRNIRDGEAVTVCSSTR